MIPEEKTDRRGVLAVGAALVLGATGAAHAAERGAAIGSTLKRASRPPRT